MTVEAHGKSTSTCRKKGTLVFTYNGKDHRLQTCLYDLSYSNLISGQRNDTYTLKSGNKKARLIVQGKKVFKMKVDAKGAMWIRIEPTKGKGKIQVVKGNEEVMSLHQRYGHISFDTLRTLPECPRFDTKPRYEACEKEKATKPTA